jgi:thioredoxin-related protein
MRILKILLYTILIIILFFLIASVVESGIQKIEKIECLQWQKEAKIYTNYYLTNWQVEQCKRYGINF